MTTRNPLVFVPGGTPVIQELPTGDTIAGSTPGPTGATGATGAAGAKGDKGDTGATGAAGQGGSPATCNGRLTLVTGDPTPVTDQTGITNVFFTPYQGAKIGLYDGASAWTIIDFANTTLALGTLTSGKNYDVFGYNNSGTLALEFSQAWSSDTARTDAVSLQDGIVVKTGATTRRYLGTIRTTATTTTEDSAAKRYVFNQYNRIARPLANATETANSWTYSTATYRQANSNAANQLDYVSGDAGVLLEATVYANASSTTAQVVSVGIGIDSTSVNSGMMFGTGISSTLIGILWSTYKGYPGLGRHFIPWLESGAGSGTQTFYGDDNIPTRCQSGIAGLVWM